MERGVAWLAPRFTDNGDGNLTELVWFDDGKSAGTAYGEDISFTTKLCAIDVQRGGTNYSSIQDALTSGSGSEIKAAARLFTENLSFTNSGALNLSGGLACDLIDLNGITTIHGTMTIAGSDGVTVSNVAVY